MDTTGATPTERTGAACRVYLPSSPITLNPADQISIFVSGLWATAGTSLDLGSVSVILMPTSTVAATVKVPLHTVKATASRTTKTVVSLPASH
jgi:hypothetical protein